MGIQADSKEVRLAELNVGPHALRAKTPIEQATNGQVEVPDSLRNQERDPRAARQFGCDRSVW
jgi:hypothetical protein